MNRFVVSRVYSGVTTTEGGEMRAIYAAVVTAVLCAGPGSARAFCGFYVSGADASLYNNATVVAMMRDGTRTVLSMQNSYKGPPQEFAMVIPVPVVLSKKQVKTLPRDIFDRLDQLAAPRLVEYWEQDPCNPWGYGADGVVEAESVALNAPTSGSYRGRKKYQVKIEAKFAVGEYQILILSAKDSTGLDAWLRDHGYKIPPGADKLLAPYIAQGMKFFVAKVDISKVTFERGQAILSPLRFHYDAEQFNLPIRLGMVNSEGTQDLIVHILGRAQRYEAANYDNVTIPTNLELAARAKDEFGSFYAALFDATSRAYPGAVITEYAWDASSCDPCPTPALTMNELATLGADVIPMKGKGGFVLTRLHARYAKGSLGEDLVFRAAGPIAGGREHIVNGGGLERGAVEASTNNFQGRYVIRHPWEGEIACEDPRRGIWGGPPGGTQMIIAAEKLGMKPPARKGELGAYVKDDVEEIDYKLSRGDDGVRFRPSGISNHACAGCATGAGGGVGALLLGLGVAVLLRRRRR
jgi:hypothetical protein